MKWLFYLVKRLFVLLNKKTHNNRAGEGVSRVFRGKYCFPNKRIIELKHKKKDVPLSWRIKRLFSENATSAPFLNINISLLYKENDD